MLYGIYEMRRSALDFWGQFLDIPANLLRSAPAPVERSLPVRASLAATDVYNTLQLTHERPAFEVTSVTIDGDAVGVREEVWDHRPFGSLVRFAKADGSSDGQPKVIIVPGLAGHFATLVRATVTTMLQDHDVFVIDWHNARDVPLEDGTFGLDDYIEYVMNFLREIGPGTHVVSVCQPAVACIAAASIMTEDDDPSAPASMTLMAGPVDTRVNPGKVNRFAAGQSIKVLERIAIHRVPGTYQGAGRRVYPGFLQVGGFMGMDPNRHLKAFGKLYRDLISGDDQSADHTRTFYEEYFAVMDATAEFYLETVQRVFLDHELPRGVLEWRGRPVRPSVIKAPLFTIEGELDEMCTPGQTEAAHELCSGVPKSKRRHLLQPGVGHYGVFSGSKFSGEIYPQMRDFIARAVRGSKVCAVPA